MRPSLIRDLPTKRELQLINEEVSQGASRDGRVRTSRCVTCAIACRKGQKLGKPVVVAGCVSQGAPRQDYIKGLSLIGVQQIDRVVEVVEETLKGEMAFYAGKNVQ